MADIVRRKNEHLDICREDRVESGIAGGFEAWRLDYLALPEMALADVDLSTQIAGKTLQAPLIIGAMTGGTVDAGKVNRVLAAAAEATGVGFALGSGRVVLERPETAPSFQVRDVAPTALLFANLGAVQFNYGVTGADASRLVEVLEADALNLHLNPLQEAIQPEGDTNFRGLSAAIDAAIADITVPVFVKEVGAGIGPATAARLAEMAIAGVETAGVGGTSWARVEALRHEVERTRQAGLALGGFGVPTAESILACREALPDRVVIASGGLRTAEQMATSLALGADAVACALPFLKAAEGGVGAVVDAIEQLIHTLRILHFVCGARTPRDLRGRARRVR
ncbi:MAG: type 2 isopentenyl-diphosphate Delta-isomerase [Myxococcota bacterium]|nr:type 2 isopentenyl-diphosphate Delta-isomerase [Myxococcota bacterium]